MRPLVRSAVVLLLVVVWLPAGAAQLLQIEHGVTVDSMSSDRFTWVDAAGRLRSASLAHNDGQTHPVTGSKGGEVRELRYETGPGTRIVRAASSPTAGPSGFGYVVSHAFNEDNCIPGVPDRSILGHFIGGGFVRVFEGRHHAIFRFTQPYPRYCTVLAPAQEYDVPVTIDWVFATGRDHPLWAVTWDLSGVPVDRLNDDSRAPHGELLFDGAATEDAHSDITGVAWGDRYRFTTSSAPAPVTYNSPWAWDTPNTIPYVKLWTTAVDATMGTVLTQTILQQDAGGYFGTDRWGTTSAGGPACLANDEGPGLPAHLMPCSFNWPFESVNYSMGASIGGSNDEGTHNTRLGWGTSFGFLGQASYPIHGSNFWGGPLPLPDVTASGWPKKSYSTFVVLGLHSLGPVEAQVGQIETVQTTALTASVGTVRTSGPKGVNDADPAPYTPAGWNHVYAAWAVQAAGNAVDVNFNPGGGTLRHPLVIVSGWTTNEPSAVRLNGGALVQDVDYFPSVRAGAQELWLTLNRDLVGATNRLEIDPGTAPPAGSGVFYTVTPCRVADTRNPADPSGGPALAANTTRAFPVTGLCSIPADATAVAINVTVVEETDVGDLRLYAAGSTPPTASTINFAVSHVRANNAIIPLGTGGQIAVQCDMPAGTTHFLFDVTGYFK